MSTQDTLPQYLSTAEAASMLGLSTTLIQSLVDRNELSGWKTRGGHRRIALQSVLDYQNAAHAGRGTGTRVRSQPKVMTVVESPELMQALVAESAHWNFALELKFEDSITAALLDLMQERPDVLIVKLSMPRLQLEKTVSALQGFNTKGRNMFIALVTDDPDLVSPPSSTAPHIQVVSGPLSPVWLHAFLMGIQATWRT